jgi:hypothetical protein
VQILGWAAGPRDGEHDVWAFYLRGHRPFTLPLVFETGKGPVPGQLTPEDTFTDPPRWENKPWFVVTTVGPPVSKVRRVRVGGTWITPP